MRHPLIRTMEQNPVVPALKDPSRLAECMRAGSGVVFVLCGDILSIGELIQQLHEGGKKAVGSYTATAKITDNNYTLTNTTSPYTIQPKSVAAQWTNTTLTYNGKEQAPTAKADTDIAGESLTVTVQGGKKAAGSYTATAKITDNNYTLTNTSTSYTIQPAT